MATNIGNSNNASGSGLNANAATSKSKSWDERVDEFSSNLDANNAFCDDDGTRFFVIKRSEGDFSKTSPFLIEKAINSIVGNSKSIKKLRSGELLVEIQSYKQATNLKKCTKLANIPITVSAHRTLNSCRGVISETDLQYVTETELLENLKDQKVIETKRIYIFRNNEKIPTKHIILTFASTLLPRSIRAGYLECPIRPYIPNPLCCFNCQRFGHSKTSCRGKLTCSRCGNVGHESSACEAPFHCVNCSKDHPSYSKSCEKWKFEKEIQTVRTKQNISYHEARKIVESRTPIVGTSYATKTALNLNKKTFRTIETQTEFPEQNISAQKIFKENLKLTTNPSEKPKASPSSISKLPLHKRSKEKTIHTQSLKQKGKSSSEKCLPYIKSNVNTTNTSLKKKKETPTTGKTKKDVNLFQEETLLTLHPTDSSGNEEDNMSINSNEGHPDVYI